MVPRLETYRSIGPFDSETLPKGLLREHRLKPGSWARLSVHSGSVNFHWDDVSGGKRNILRQKAACWCRRKFRIISKSMDRFC